MFERLLELKKDGTLNLLVSAGLMTVKVHMYIEIYMYVHAKMTVNKNLKKTKAVENCADIMQVSIETVWRALRVMETSFTTKHKITVK